MKTTRLLGLLVTVSIFFMSCSKDDASDSDIEDDSSTIEEDVSDMEEEVPVVTLTVVDFSTIIDENTEEGISLGTINASVNTDDILSYRDQ